MQRLNQSARPTYSGVIDKRLFGDYRAHGVVSMLIGAVFVLGLFFIALAVVQSRSASASSMTGIRISQAGGPGVDDSNLFGIKLGVPPVRKQAKP